MRWPRQAQQAQAQQAQAASGPDRRNRLQRQVDAVRRARTRAGGRPRGRRRPATPPALPPVRALSSTQQIGKQGGFTALHYAVREGHRATARLLVDGGTDLDHPTGGDESTPMLVAVINGHYDLARDLLERGADPNLTSDDGAAPALRNSEHRVVAEDLVSAARSLQAAGNELPRADAPAPGSRRRPEPAHVHAHLVRGLQRWPDGRRLHPAQRHSGEPPTPPTSTRCGCSWSMGRIPTSRHAEAALAGAASPSRAPRPSRKRGPIRPAFHPVPTGGPAVHPLHAAAGCRVRHLKGRAAAPQRARRVACQRCAT